MSQAALQSEVPPAFRRAPMNPYSERVNTEMAKMQEHGGAPQQPVYSPPAPVQTQAPSPPAPVQTQAPSPVQPPVAQQPVYSPPVAQPQVPQQMSYDPRILVSIQRMEQERNQLAEQNAQQQQTINNLLATQQEYDQIKQRQALREAIPQDVFNELSTVAPEDAARITDAILNATAPVITGVHQELAKTRQMVNESYQQMQKRQREERAAQLVQKITQAHPDFMALQGDPNYINFMNQRDGLSSYTRDQRAAQEFEAGNADYIVSLLNQLKGVTPSAEQMMSVAPVQMAGSVTAAAAQPEQPVDTLSHLNNLMHTRQISHDEYRARLKAMRAVQNAL